MNPGTPFTDLALEANAADGILDLALDAGQRDLAVIDGFETAIVTSLFSDRRAAADEVADPMRRRGWIGNLIADTPGDNYGSGLWLYEQSRGTREVCNAIEDEARQALAWMVEERLVKSVAVAVTYDPRRRRMSIAVVAVDALGGVTRRSYEIWSRTATGTLARNV